MKVTFLRHAQSEANIRWCLPTRDSTLTKLGVHQSQSLTGHYDIVYCSPLRRARETLSGSSITCDELVFCNEVRECVYSVDDILFDEAVSDDFIETDEDIAQRCHKFYQMLLAKNKDDTKKVLVLSHFGFISEFSSLYCSHRFGLDVATMVEEDIKSEKRSEKKNKHAGMTKSDNKSGLASGLSSDCKSSNISSENKYSDTDSTSRFAPGCSASHRRAPSKAVRVQNSKNQIKSKTKKLPI